jgi:hypothetical protein
MSCSTRSQPRTYSERVEAAIATEALLTGGTQIMLVDELTLLPRNNPVWCSYGTSPTAGFLIDKSGKIVKAQRWLDVSAMENAIDDHLK